MDRQGKKIDSVADVSVFLGTDVPDYEIDAAREKVPPETEDRGKPFFAAVIAAHLEREYRFAPAVSFAKKSEFSDFCLAAAGDAVDGRYGTYEELKRTCRTKLSVLRLGIIPHPSRRIPDLESPVSVWEDWFYRIERDRMSGDYAVTDKDAVRRCRLRAGSPEFRDADFAVRRSRFDPQILGSFCDRNFQEYYEKYPVSDMKVRLFSVQDADRVFGGTDPSVIPLHDGLLTAEELSEYISERARIFVERNTVIPKSLDTVSYGRFLSGQIMAGKIETCRQILYESVKHGITARTDRMPRPEQTPRPVG